jgi:hypothetical protein
MVLYYAERGDSPKSKIITKDELGNLITPDTTPICRILLGTRIVATLSVSNSAPSTYVAFWTVPANALLDTIYVVEWSWVYSTRPYIKRDKIYVYQTGVSKR